MLFCLLSALIICVLWYCIYQRFEAEKSVIKAFLELDSASLEYVQILMQNPRIEREQIDPNDRSLIESMCEDDWFMNTTDGCLIRAGKTEYFARRLKIKYA